MARCEPHGAHAGLKPFLAQNRPELRHDHQSFEQLGGAVPELEEMALSEQKKRELQALSDAFCEALVALAERNREESRVAARGKSV